MIVAWDMVAMVVGVGEGCPSGSCFVVVGGRVLCVTALGDDVKAARDAAYAAAEHIRFDGLTRRSDIGWRAIERYS